jgi:hypothetical protein
METKKTNSRFVKWAVIIGIIIVLNLFFNYAISLVYKAPDYPAYCPETQIDVSPTTKAACIAVGGKWSETVYPPDRTAPVPTTPQAKGYCDPTFTCRQTFEKDLKVYERNAFVTLIILGVISIALGLFLKVSEAVTIGLAFGGVLSLVIAAIRYWSYADNILKVVLLGVALVALIWIGIKKFQE